MQQFLTLDELEARVAGLFAASGSGDCGPGTEDFLLFISLAG